jgi:outer membrane protein, heavy metal efflux system
MPHKPIPCGTGTPACALRYATHQKSLSVPHPCLLRVGSDDPKPQPFLSSPLFGPPKLSASALNFLSPSSRSAIRIKLQTTSPSPCPLCASSVPSVVKPFSFLSSRSVPSKTNFIAKLILFILAGSLPCMSQEPMNMPPDQMQHHHMDIPTVQPFYPHLGRAQENSKSPLFTLEQAQQLAANSNPTLRQAESEIRAAKARHQQAGLYPNPTIGYAGDEIRGGSVNGGKQGFFVEQTIVTGGKLARSKDVYAQEIQLAEIEAQEQKIRVETAVKTAFYRVLAAQELLDARRDLATIEQNYATAQRQLFNTGQADETEVLDAEVAAERLRLFTRIQENSLHEEWRSLAAVLGRPELPLATVAGDLEHNWPDLDADQAVESIATQSPATRIADANSARAAALLARSKRQSIPDLQLRGGLEYNNEPLGSAPHAIGWEGVAEVGVEIPIFNRNQGNIAADSAALDRANLEKQRMALTLRDRAATAADQYASAKLMALDYRDELLPRAKKSYALMVEKYGQMLAANPHVLDSQRKLFVLQNEYILSLEKVWISGIALQGFLLTDGLEAPALPGEIDRPVRETNLPVPERIMPGASSIEP